MNRLTVSHKAWILGGITLMIILGANLAFALLGYNTRSPSECMSCHERSYKTWEGNKIHRTSIKCLYCHSTLSSSLYGYIPGKFTARVKDVDRNCLRCHENFMDEKKLKATILAEWVDDSSGKVLKVFGPWDIKEITCRAKFSCQACHQNIAHDKADSPTNLPRVNYCAACHYHREKDAFSQVYPTPRLVIIKNGERFVSPGIL